MCNLLLLLATRYSWPPFSKVTLLHCLVWFLCCLVCQSRMTMILRRILPLSHFGTRETFQRCQLTTPFRQSLPSRLMSGLQAKQEQLLGRTRMLPTT